MIERHFVEQVEQEARKNPAILKPSSPQNGKGQLRPVGILMEGVAEQSVNWLWKDRIPLNAITVLDGDPASGKSLLTLELAARISRGHPLPGGKEFTEPGGVVLCSAEDSLSHVIKPRLRAANADTSRILALPYTPDFPKQITFSKLPNELPILRRAIERVGAKLVVLDVLMCFIPTTLSASRDQDVRSALGPLAELADATGVAIVAIRHLNKDTSKSAIYRGGGSVGISGAARSVLLLAPDPHNPDHRILARVKSNLGGPSESIGFKIVAQDGVPHVEWTGSSSHTADSLLAPAESGEDRSARHDAVAFLREELNSGPVESLKLLAAAKQQGIAEKTLRRAKDSMGVIATKSAGKWYWKVAT